MPLQNSLADLLFPLISSKQKALPLINFGAYSLCIEFAVIALCVAILAVAPPQIVATMGALPGGFSKIIVCVLAIIILLWQVVGIVSIKREATRLYRIYIRVNFILTLLTILATLVFFVVSAARHSAAVTACTAAYGATPAGSQSTGTSDLTNVGTKICDIFIWVQIGFMGLLLVLIGLTQVRLIERRKNGLGSMEAGSADLFIVICMVPAIHVCSTAGLWQRDAPRRA